MKKLSNFALICASVVAATTLTATTSHATQLFGDPFSYPDNTTLAGTSGWVQQGTSTTNPITVTGGAATINNTGQDINGGFAQTLTPTDGGSVYITFTINVSAANTAGDYFLGTNTTTGSTNNSDRVYIKSTTGGYLLGIVGGSGGTVSYGTGTLTLGTSYQVILKQNFVAGTLNDTFTFYTNPTDRTTEANNTPYAANLAYGGTSAEATSFGALLLRQGTAANAPTLTLDNVGVATTFAEAAAATQPLVFAAVPEPATYAWVIGGLGALALGMRRRSVA